MHQPTHLVRHPARPAQGLGRLVSMLALLAACTVVASAQRGRPTQEDAALVPVQTVWPLPPDVPRVKWVGSFRTAEDIEGPPKKSMLDSLRTTLLGNDATSSSLAAARQLEKPHGVAVDSTSRVFVADTLRAQVIMFDFDRRRFVQVGGGASQVSFRVPIGVAVDARDNLYVSDNGHGLIFVFDPDLKYLGALNKPGELQAPTGIAIDFRRDRLYAVDTRRHSLSTYDLSSGRRVKQIGEKGSEPGQFGWPSGVAVGPDGLVYVSDTMNYRVQVFDPELRFVRSFGSLGVNPGQFRRPKGIAVDADHIVYVVDSDFNNVQLFDDQGRPLLAVGSYGPRPGQMLLPAGVSVHGGRAKIYVTEQGNHRVQVFERVVASK